MRIDIADFSDETMTFLKEPTGIERFEPGVRRGSEMIAANRAVPTYINGYLSVLEREGVKPVPLLEANKFLVPGPFSGWITNECSEKYATEIQERLAAAGHLDGVLLALHGAMAVTGVPKLEAEICRRVRAVVGDIPIMVTLDLHAHEDHELTDASGGVFILKTYPHIDSREIGQVAASCMVSTIRGEMRPVQVCRKPGLAWPSIFQGSLDYPMKDIYGACRRLEQLARKVADELSDLAWLMRDGFNRKLPGAKDAVAAVMQLVAEGQRPVVIADGADRIGDSTHVLRELLEQGATNWAVPGIVEFAGRPSYTLIGPMGKGRKVQDGFVVRLNLGRNWR